MLNIKTKSLDQLEKLELRRQEIYKMAKKKNCSLESFDCSNLKNPLYYNCNIHNSRSKTTIKIFLNEETKLRCCENVSRQVSPVLKLQAAAEQRGHTLIQPFPTSRSGTCTILCKKHTQISHPTVDNYLRLEWGTPCCGKEASAKSRITHGLSIGRPNPPWRISAEMVRWRNQVKKLIFQGFPLVKNKKQVVHHLYSASQYGVLRFVNLNGFLIDEDLHFYFHQHVGKNTACTPGLLVNYILFLQKNKDGELSSQGSCLDRFTVPSNLLEIYKPEEIQNTIQQIRNQEVCLKIILINLYVFFYFASLNSTNFLLELN
jgi:hypothetical protein